MTNSVDSLIKFSVDQFFKHHRFSETRDEKNFYRGDVVISCRNKQLTIDWVGDSCGGAIFSHRVNPILNLISQVMDREGVDLDCRIILGPHDSINKGDPVEREVSKVGFCCPLNSPHFAIPDPHYLSYVANPVPDTVKWEDKRDQVVFRGTDGSMDRINFSFLSYPNSFIDSKISRFLSHDKGSLLSQGIDINHIQGDWLTHHDQLEFKYILDLYGHSIGWDRPCWGLPSNSIVILGLPKTQRSFTWYYPYIKENKIIPEFAQEDLASRSDLAGYDDVFSLQQSFASYLLEPQTPYLFMKEFLINYNAHYNS